MGMARGPGILLNAPGDQTLVACGQSLRTCRVHTPTSGWGCGPAQHAPIQGCAWCLAYGTPGGGGGGGGGGVEHKQHKQQHTMHPTHSAVRFRNLADENKDCWHQLLPAPCADEQVLGNAIHTHTHSTHLRRRAKPK